MTKKLPPLVPARDTTVDLLVIGSGTGLAAALAAHELGLSTLVVEKTAYVGGSTARSGGAFWIPGNSLLPEKGSQAVPDAGKYLQAVVGESAPAERSRAYLEHGAAAVDMLARTTPMRFFWAEGYSDYHPEQPGGRPAGRTCECRPFDAAVLRDERPRLRPGVMAAPVPMPVTGADYKWMNLVARKPGKAIPRIIQRLVLGVGGKLIGRDYVAGGQALAAGLYAGVLRAGIPVWTETSLVRLTGSGGRVSGAVLRQAGTEVTVTARRGVVLAAGGFDHDMAARHELQSPRLGEHASLGADGNTGDGIRAAQEVGAGLALMDQAWWFPAFAPLPGSAPAIMLAERSLPGSFIVDQTGKRFINESIDYMSFGQAVLARERAGTPVEQMWMVFDQRYRNNYILAGGVFPRQPIPEAWYRAGVAHRSDDLDVLARAMGVPAAAFRDTFERFNAHAGSGHDPDFRRGDSAYDRYYGDPTVAPNPNLAPLRKAPYYAVKMVLSDLGTCGGVVADEHARVRREDGTVIEGLYAIGNTAANAFGTSYPGAGATIGQGIVYGYIAACHAAAS
ncbi:3-ketosteroid-delta-1-dehydrogenase [Amycolatopsis viridis]|uniref:Succinate dehydrogenase/fumarate reductase flavoprotein subunit n=1 Tax=Amycolatopsis viridis TaxID=185678 RepID=A0ABX0SYY0_9PSEU|nr:3-ketosteroid-delta-1-dehydrogenase [Amycolatopsis viridis]NIH80785.1 succinate dehydrogenase/fumarate reductase flavoprotein subunit [Amycolatopsis viridis]